MKHLIPSLVLMTLAASPVLAEEKKPLLDKQKFSIGAGISRNSVASFDETGFQFFGAYQLSKVNLMEGVNSSVEFGYMDYGDFPGGNAGGLWGTYVIDGNISGGLGWLARLGLDIGDDDGLMFGAGISFDLSSKMELRGEYVARDDLDSIQINFLYHL